MAYSRPKPYLHATWISKYLTGDKSCLWACWYKANFQGFERMPSDFDVARWTMDHTDALNRLIAELEEQGCRLYIENQNSFRVEGTRSGAVIGGRADLVAVFPDGRTVVYDVKTGQESASHIVQVQLYMYLLPKANLFHWKDAAGTLEGAVVYGSGHQIDIPAASVDEMFEARVADFMQRMVAPVPPRHVPSVPECGFCELTLSDCTERIQVMSA